ncbi:MAG TPA: DUF5687 family protein, partial [bacterium]|nr:DUF5687 family protein [bacterium]
MASRVIFGVMMVVVMLNLLGLGLFLDQFFRTAAPEVNPVRLLSAGIFYYLAADLILRFFLQRMPVQSIRPYLLIPVGRKHLVHLLLVRSSLSFFNLLPLLVVIPFVVTVGTEYHTGPGMLSWVGTLMLLLLCNSYLNFYLKKHLFTNAKIVAGFAGVLGVLLAMDYFALFSLSDLSTLVFTIPLQYPWIIFVPVALLLGFYRMNYVFVRSHLYPETLSPRRERTVAFSGFRLLSQLGEIGLFLALELKLLFRNKRARATLWLSLAVLPLGIVIYRMMPLDRTDFYPVPETTSGDIGLVSKTGSESQLSKQVTFVVVPGQPPPDTYVYIAGDHAQLGEWDPREVSLVRRADSSWVITRTFPENTALRYKFTLGSWETEAVNAGGRILDVATLTVRNDTTLTVHVAGFQKPRRHVIMDINIMYFGLMLTGMFLLAYGQFVFGWESNYFDLILSGKIDFNTYLRSKFWFLGFSVIILYLLLLPYALISVNLLYIHGSLALYNIGINSPLILFLSTYTRKRMDLTASILGTQGKGGAQYLTILPTLILPILIMIPLRITGLGNGIFAVYGILGLAGIFLQRPLRNLLVAQFSRQKYRIAV